MKPCIHSTKKMKDIDILVMIRSFFVDFVGIKPFIKYQWFWLFR